MRDKGERRHQEAVTAFDKALAVGDMVTTDYVLDETFTLLFRRLPVHKATELLEFLIAQRTMVRLCSRPFMRPDFGKRPGCG